MSTPDIITSYNLVSITRRGQETLVTDIPVAAMDSFAYAVQRLLVRLSLLMIAAD